VGPKIGLIRPKRHTTEVIEEGGGLGLKIGPKRPKSITVYQSKKDRKEEGS
jgi:hypothetical protein